MILTNSRRERFVQGIISGATATAAYKAAGYAGKGSAQSAQRLLKQSEIQARKAELERGIEGQFVAGQIAERQYRLTVIQDVVDRLRMVIDERAAAGRADEAAAPGAGTGLLARARKNLRVGKKIVIVDEYSVDGVVLSKLYEGLKQAAIEAGEWQEEGRVLPPATVDVSHLTPEQVLAEQKVLRRAKEEIEAIRQQKEPTAAIEPVAGSVDPVEESGAEVEPTVDRKRLIAESVLLTR